LADPFKGHPDAVVRETNLTARLGNVAKLELHVGGIGVVCVLDELG
jgi:hypothetical protein